MIPQSPARWPRRQSRTAPRRFVAKSPSPSPRRRWASPPSRRAARHRRDDARGFARGAAQRRRAEGDDARHRLARHHRHRARRAVADARIYPRGGGDAAGRPARGRGARRRRAPSAAKTSPRPPRSPGSTADARVATVPKRHVTSPAPAPAPAPRKNVTDAPPVSGDANDVVASVPAADAATAVAASDSGAARRACHAADPWRPASSPYAAASAVVAATRAPRAARARGPRTSESPRRRTGRPRPASTRRSPVRGVRRLAAARPLPAKRNAHRDRSVNPDDFAAAVATTRLPPPASPARGATAATDAMARVDWKTGRSW